MQIPGFTVERTIGKGGMGTVYLATQESLERAVVLKTLNVADTETPQFFERFMNEGRIVASLRHPHIITVYDIGKADELLWISMEYVEGGDLKNRIVAPFPPLEALGIVAKVASALDLAHRKGIVHRDVKPANILFHQDGTPLLSDFGIAKQTQTDSELTSTGTILGSPYYMSPEQAEGMHVDGRTDIYSLGVIFYEMLTGQRPYQGDSAVKVILQHIQSPIPELPGEYGRFTSLLNRMMAKDRDLRFPDAAILVREVAKLQRAENRSLGITQETQRGDASVTGQRRVEHSSIQAYASVARDRTVKMLLFLLALMSASFVALYAYSESLKTPTLVVTRPLPDPAHMLPAQVGPSMPSANTAANPANTPEPLRDDVVKALEWLAENSLKTGRLTAPPADNAHYYYQRLLALDPGNKTGLRGFSDIAEQYVVLAEQEFARKNYERAQELIRQGLQVQPGNEGLLTLQGFIVNRDKSLWERIAAFVLGEK
jgi:serine/threonine protein kinase